MKRKVIRCLKAVLLLSTAFFLWLFTARTTPEAVQQKLAELTAARVELESAERLWFGPGVRLHRVSLESEAYRFQADQLEIRFAYLPLLWGEARPDSLALSDARLTLSGKGRAESPLGRLPLDASWNISRLALEVPVGGEVRELFYLDSARLEWLSTGGARVALAGSPASTQTTNFRLEGEVSSLSADSFPDGKLHAEFTDFPAQPLVEFFTGDRLALRTARLEGNATVQSAPQEGTATGRLVAATPAHKLLEADFQLAATPDLLHLESARGELAGNDFEASGGIKDWLKANREVDISLQLPQAQLRSDTVELLHEALGREALGFAENLRGGFSATMQLRPASGQSPVTGEIELEGMTYASKRLPALEDLRGRLRLEGSRVFIAGVAARMLDTPGRLSGEVRGTQVALQLDTDGIPLANFPWQADEALPIENLTGQVRVHADIGGQALEPTVSGAAELTGGGFDFRGVEIRDTAGEIEFDLVGGRASSLQGRAGGCNFELAAAAPFVNWQDSASARLRLPACELGELARLAEQTGALPWWMRQAGELAGQGTVTMELDGRVWRGEIITAGAMWSPAGLRQPVNEIEFRVDFDASGFRIQRLTGRVGNSPVSLQGGVEDRAAPPWKFQLETTLEPADIEDLLPATWLKWIQIPSAFSGHAHLVGSAEGLRIQAELLSEAAALASRTGPTPMSGSDGHEIKLLAVWSDGRIEVQKLEARFNSAVVQAAGNVPLDAEKPFHFEAIIPLGSPLPDLLSFARLPEKVGPVEGKVSGEITFSGLRRAPEWFGKLRLEEFRLPALLTPEVYLQGELPLGSGDLYFEDMRVVQPQGEFRLGGWVKPSGRSELKLAGPWLDLDRLLGQLPGGHWSHPEGEFWVRHPVRLSIAMDEVKFFDSVFSDVRGELRQEEGRLQLNVADFAFGTGSGHLFAETYPERHEVLVRLELDQVPTERFLTELMGFEPAVSGSLSLDAELTGPLAGHEGFLEGAHGRINFKIPQGRLQRGTLPERLFAVAVLLNEGLYGFGLNRLARLFKPTGLRRFRDWTGTLELEGGKARIVESTLYARAYDVTLTGESDLSTGAFQVHGDGNFHPGWEFDISIQAIVNLFARAFQLARGKRNTPFEFDVAGEIRGSKRVQNFRFK